MAFIQRDLIGCDRQVDVVIRDRARCRGGDDIQGMRRHRIGRAAERDREVLVGFHVPIAADVDRDRLHGLARSERDRAAGQRAAEVRRRHRRAAHRVVHRGRAVRLARPRDRERERRGQGVAFIQRDLIGCDRQIDVVVRDRVSRGALNAARTIGVTDRHRTTCDVVQNDCLVGFHDRVIHD